MPRQENTKDKILGLGESLIRKRGFNAFSYQDISSDLDIKNAAIHYHFPTKELLGMTIIRENIRRFFEQIESIKEWNEWDQLKSFLEIFEENQKKGMVCLVGALSPEYNTLPEGMQDEFKEMVQNIQQWLIKLLKDGKRKKLFTYKTTPEAKALMILTNMIAGLLYARVTSKSSFTLIKEGILKELKP